MLGLAMVLEEQQRTIQIQADAKAHKGERSAEEAQQEALNACERMDEKYKLLIGLFQCKYRDKKWTRGSFGQQTPTMSEPAQVEFLTEVHSLLQDNGMLVFRFLGTSTYPLTRITQLSTFEAERRSHSLRKTSASIRRG